MSEVPNSCQRTKMGIHARLQPWLKLGLSVVIQVAVFVCFAKLIDDEWHSHVLPYLAWPSILAAQLGLSHTWFLVPFTFLIPTVVVLSLSVSPKQKIWPGVFLLNAGWIAGWVFFGWCAMDLYPNPAPKHTIFDDNTENRKAYLETYQTGFQVGKMGWYRTYCFAPSVPTRGHYDGMRAGAMCFDRVVGTEQEPDLVPEFWIYLVVLCEHSVDTVGKLLDHAWRYRPWWLGGLGSDSL